MPSIANLQVDWGVLGRGAVRRIGRLLFPDAQRRARVGSALHRRAVGLLTLGGKRAALRAAMFRLRGSPPGSTYRLEIDRERALEEMSVHELLRGKQEGVAIAVPEIYVPVKGHPLSLPSTNPEEAETYRDHQFRAPEMALERLHDHYWFPQHGFLISKRGKVWHHSLLGQFADPDFLTTYAVQKKNGDLHFHEFLLHGCPVIDEAVAITSHYASHNYGHFMLDMVPLIHKLASIGLQFASRPLLPWHEPIYRRLGIAPQRLRIVTDHVVLLRDVLVSNRHNAEGTYAASPQIRESAQALLSNVRVAGVRSNRIFVARASSLSREMRNRSQLAGALMKRGFAVVHPELLSFEEQATTFAHADLIVSEFGAAMANVVFCRPRTTVVEIVPDDQLDPWSAHLCAALDLEHITLFHRVKEADRIPIEIGGRVLKKFVFKFDTDIGAVCRVVESLLADQKAGAANNDIQRLGAAHYA